MQRFKVGSAVLDPLLGTAHFGGSHQLHGLGDLHGALYLLMRSLMSFMEPAMRYASFPLMRLDKAVGIGREHALELLFGVLVQIAGGADGLHDGGTGGIVVQILVQALLVLDTSGTLTFTR